MLHCANRPRSIDDRRKIMAIAVTLIALMAVTAVMTVVLVMQVGARIEELTYSYMPA